MDNVFIAKLNENTLKMTPTDVMVHKHATCAQTHTQTTPQTCHFKIHIISHSRF